MKKTVLTPFEQALLEANLEEFQSIPTEEELALSFSSKFQREAERIIQNAGNRHYRCRSRALQRLVLVALIAGLLILTACAVPAIREALIDFFFQDEGTHYEFTYDPEQAAAAPDILETIYMPVYIPEEFTLVVEDINDAGVVLMWHSAEDQWINFMQTVIPDDPSLGDGGGFNSEGARAEWIVLNSRRALRIEDDEWIHLAWTNSEYEFSLSCSDKTMEEEFYQVFGSIRQDSSRKP